MNEAAKEIEVILKKYNLKTGYRISFAQYKILPVEVRLAMVVLEKHGMKIDFLLKPIQPPEKK